MRFCFMNTPQYTLLPQSDGSWGIRHNWSAFPYMIGNYPTPEDCHRALENLKRKPIDVW